VSSRVRRIISATYESPRLAVWWYTPSGLIIGDSEGYNGNADNDKIEEGVLTDFAGNVQLNIDHVDLWSLMKRTCKECMGLEYEEMPRGRVIFNSRTRKWIVIGESGTIKDPRFRFLIKREFNLPTNTLFEEDDHYRLNPSLNFTKADRDSAKELMNRFMTNRLS
jgi:hypothetical protein